MSGENTHYALLVDYVLNIAHLGPEDVRFIRLDGSVANGTDRRFSDYDLVVVCNSDRQPEKRDFWGVFNGRLVSFWAVSLDDYRDTFCEIDENEFIWQKYPALKAMAIFGDQAYFDSLLEKLRVQNWTQEIQDKAITYHYGNIMEYLGKLLNTFPDSEEEHIFFFNAVQFAGHYARFIATLNRLDIQSDNTLYKQIFSAQRKPENLDNDLLTVSGFSGKARSKDSTLSSARKLVDWARNFLINDYGLDHFEDSGFRDVVKKLSYLESESP